MSDIAHFINKLKTFRNHIRLWHFCMGLGYFSVFTVLIFFLNFLLDRFLRFDLSQRIICLVVETLTLIFILYHHVLVPIFKKISNEYLCAAIEKRLPEFGQLITSGYQLAKLTQPECYGYSLQMIERTVRDCLDAIEKINVRELLNHKLRMRGISSGVISVLLIGMFAFLFPKDFMIWIDRNLLLQNTKWPSQTILSVKNKMRQDTLYVPHGDSFTLIVEADSRGAIPEQLKIITYDPSGKQVVYASLLKGNQYIYRFEEVKQNFRVMLLGGDDELGPIDVKTIAKPHITEVHFDALPPDYTGIRPYELDPDVSSWSLVKGSLLQIRGIADKEISSLQLRRDGVTLLLETLEISKFNFALPLTAEQMLTGVYDIRLMDVDQIATASNLSFVLNIVPDKLPEATMKVDYYSDVITSQAVVHLHWAAKDDFGIKKAVLKLWEITKEENYQLLETVKIFETTDRQIKREEGTKILRLEDYALKANMRVLLTIEAEDFSAHPIENKMKSTGARFLIIGHEEYEKYLLNQEQGISVLVDRLAKEQETVRLQSASLNDKLVSASEPILMSVNLLTEIDKAQKQMEQQNFRLITRLEQLVNDIGVNHLADYQVAQERLQTRVITLLSIINESLIPSILNKSNSAKNEKLVSNKITFVKEIIEAQEIIVYHYKNMLKALKRWEGYYEVIGALKSILQDQEKLKQETEDRKKEKIKDIFDE